VYLGVGLPGHCWNPYHRVAPNSSSRGCVTGRWASHVVVGFPSLALRTIRRRWVVYLGVGVLHCRSALPWSLWGRGQFVSSSSRGSPRRYGVKGCQ